MVTAVTEKTPDLSAPVRELLAAIAEVLDAPAPALSLEDEVAHRWLVDDRIGYVQVAIRDILAGKADLGIEWEASYLRRKAAERPPGYRTLAQAVEERGEGQ